MKIRRAREFPSAIDGEVTSAEPAVAGLSVNNPFGEDRPPNRVTNSAFAPLRDVVQPAGSAGAVTPSKFSLKRRIGAVRKTAAEVLKLGKLSPGKVEAIIAKATTRETAKTGPRVERDLFIPVIERKVGLKQNQHKEHPRMMSIFL